MGCIFMIFMYLSIRLIELQDNEVPDWNFLSRHNRFLFGDELEDPAVEIGLLTYWQGIGSRRRWHSPPSDQPAIDRHCGILSHFWLLWLAIGKEWR